MQSGIVRSSGVGAVGILWDQVGRGGNAAQGYSFSALDEQLRAPQVVRAAVIQNAIVSPTTAPYSEQRDVSREPPPHTQCAARTAELA